MPRAEPVALRHLRLEVLVTPGTDPRINLTLEDELLVQVEDGSRPETLRLWVNEECLVRGPNQSCSSGWHLPETAERLGVPIHTRTTGGGTVYHDSGNLNWSFYLRRSEGYVGAARLSRACSGVILEALATLSVEGAFAAPNRIDVAGRKVSGLASRASFGAVLVHGTLLIASDVERLNMLCLPPPGCPPVATLREFRPGITVSEVIEAISRTVRDRPSPLPPPAGGR